jgi:hypothetical protein
MWDIPFRDTWLNIFDSPYSYHYISDCIVDFETGLIYKEGQIIWEAANENMVWYNGWISSGWISGDPRWNNRISRQDLISERMKKQAAYFEDKIRATSQIPEINEGVTLHLLHPFNRYVFGHIFDTLQKLYTIEKEKLVFQTVLLPRTHEIIDFDLHLKCLGLDEKKIIHSNLGLVKVSSLLFINPISHPTSFTPESYLFIRNKYHKFFAVDGSAIPSTKVFLTRRSGKFSRHLINDGEIEVALKKEQVIYLDGTQNFKEIVNAFSSASHIAGVHGSLFTNNIYANENAKYLEYCPRARENHTFHHQYKLCASYRHELVENDEHWNIEIDLNHLLDFYKS